MGNLLYSIFGDPFVQMWQMPDFFIQVIWEGFVSGILYALIALGFVLIFKASGIFNFAQGIMVLYSGLTLVGLHEMGVPAFIALIITLAVMYALAFVIELVLRNLVNQPDIILFMATIGITNILIGGGQWMFGGETKTMITSELLIPTGSSVWEPGGGLVIFQHIDIAAAVIAALLIVSLALFFSKTKVGRVVRAVADDHQASLSVGISLNQIWVITWFAAGIVALVAGIMWAQGLVKLSLQIIALKALPVLYWEDIGTGAIVGGLIIGIGEKLLKSIGVLCLALGWKDGSPT